MRIKKEVLYAFLFFGVILFVGYSIGRGKKDSIVPSLTGTIAPMQDDMAPRPTSFPFIEMTIPYLRNRQYESSMGELKKLSENGSYTSYTTSYTSDGLKVNGLLTIPKGEIPEGGYPAIVFVHGYIAPTRYKTTQNYVAYVDYLAKNKMIVFKIDLRGHDQSEGEAGGGYYSSDYIIDTLSAVEALKTLPSVHKERIGLWGHSMAGNVLMRSLAAKRDLKAVAIWAGAVYTYEDMQTYGIQDNSYRPPEQSSERARKRKELFDTHGQFSPENEFWKQVPATNYLDGITGAVGLFHAVDDAVVNVEYSRGLQEILDPTGIPNELHEYKSGGHNISGTSFTQAMKDTVAFFQKNL